MLYSWAPLAWGLGMSNRLLVIAALILPTLGCLEQGIFDPGIGPAAPRNLTYFLDPVADRLQPDPGRQFPIAAD